MPLRVAPKLALPDEAVTRSFGILGMRGSGKSNAGVVLAEEMFRVGLHWVTIDPKGDWWGIRSSADGTGPGLPVVIFGGEHGDVPLEPTASAGVLVADTILAEGMTCVLDLSQFSKGGKIAFLAGHGRDEGFAGRLFRKKRRDGAPLHVFLEEAHDYVPQNPRGELGKLIDVVSSLQTMGRTRGIGCSVISQRSARVHKDVLTQVDTLLAFRTIAPQDRKAILEWVKHYGLAQDLVESLPELAAGQAWLWSPEWLDELAKVQFRRRSTYDSGATPEIGKAGRRPATLADVDLGAISEAMASTIEKAKADDPRELRRRIADLEAEVSYAKSLDVQVREVRVEVPVISGDELERLEQVAAATFAASDTLAGEARRLSERIGEAYAGKTRQDGTSGPAPREVPRVRADARDVQRRNGATARIVRESVPGEPQAAASANVKAGARRILETFARHYPMRMTKAQLGTLAKFKVTGGTFQTYYSQLKRLGYLDESGGDIGITESGLEFIGEVPRSPMTTEELLDQWRSALKAGARAMLDVLVGRYPTPVTRDELASAVDMTVTGGTFGTYLGTLRRNGLATVDGDFVRASESLFLATR